MSTPADHSGSSSARLPALCPYCGHGHDLAPGKARPLQCDACKGRFEPLSRQATQNAMGPWQVRDESQPFRPPCSYETIVKLAQRGKIGPTTIVRGPTTRQFWSYARDTPGVAAVLGFCHACHTPIAADDAACPSCESILRPESDRQRLGLSPKAALPGEASPEQIAAMIRPRTPQVMPAARPEVPAAPSPLPRPAEPSGHEVPSTQAPVSLVPDEPVRDRRRPKPSGWLKGLIAVQLFVIVVLAIALVAQMQGQTEEQDGDQQAAGSNQPAASATTQPPAPTGAALDPTVGAETESGETADGPTTVPREDDLASLMDDAMRPFAARYWAVVEGTRSDDVQVLERSIGQLVGLREEAVAAEPGGDFTLVDDLIMRARERLERLRLIEEFGGMP